MASSSSFTPSQQRKYEVFLSFRGEDTRNTFVSHLHSALQQRGIISFFDENNLKHGQSISPELAKAIEESKFAIIVFSKNYASSTWCLDELVKIMECEAKYGLTVIPLFYDVHPSDVRNQTNSFAESFAKHEVNFKDKVQIWKQNLFEAANLAGVDIRGKDEASCINTIVKDIFNKLPQEAFTKGLVGMESRLPELRSLFSKKHNEVCFLGIWGMGGVGKTTIARTFFYEVIGGFEGRGCFLHDVSRRDMVSLQEILLKKVLNEPVEISDAYAGSILIRDRLHFTRVLLVLDNVDDVMQIQSLAGEREWFGAGSRIIITTRDKHLLEDVDYEPYEVNLLSESEAMQLFCWHAFKKCTPAEDFVHLSRRVVSYASGLPLALKVLGGHLRGRGLSVWESALERLKDDPEDKIFVTFKISFDGLNDSQRDIFLDIACFYRGELVDNVKRMLDTFGFHSEEGINVLVQKSLLRIELEKSESNADGVIEMHDLVQEMGRHIIRRKANKQPGKYSRLWRYDDISQVLKDNNGTSEIEAIVLSGFDGRIELSKGDFRKMNRLRLLKIQHGVFDGCPDHLPNSLRWLHLLYYPAKSLPRNFGPRNLVVLELIGARIVQSPDFSAMPNLELIDLSYCENLSKLHPSIGNLNKLVRLHLVSCRNLERFPRIIQMEHLETLDLQCCHELQSIPENITRCSHLQFLYLNGCFKLEAIPVLPSSIKKLGLNVSAAFKRFPNLVHLLGENEYLQEMSLLDCKHILLNWKFRCNTPYLIILQQLRVAYQFLSPFWDWGCMSRILSPRKEMLTVYLPTYQIPNYRIPEWLYVKKGPWMTVSLSPSSYKGDKLQGFAILCAATEKTLEFSTGQQRVPRMLPLSIFMGATYPCAGFIYVPISKVISNRAIEELKDSCLFQITGPYMYDKPSATVWGFRLVCEGEGDNYHVNNSCELKLSNQDGPIVGGDATFKVRVASYDY